MMTLANPSIYLSQAAGGGTYAWVHCLHRTVWIVERKMDGTDLGREFWREIRKIQPLFPARLDAYSWVKQKFKRLHPRATSMYLDGTRCATSCHLVPVAAAHKKIQEHQVICEVGLQPGLS